MDNLLIKGENLEALKWLLENGYREKIDLVYIDPPFATGGKFGIDKDGRVATISKSQNSEIAYTDTLKGSDFLKFLKERLILIRELLSEKGSIYLHIDYKIGHYVKVMMDEVFGMENFRNDITRIKCNPKNFSRIGYGNIKDMILFYTKGANPIWHEPYDNFSSEDIETLYPKINKDGRRYTTIPLHAPGETKNGASSMPFKGLYPPQGRHWRCSVDKLEELDRQGLIEWSSTGNPRKIIFADESKGKKTQDIWTFKDPSKPLYPTEKNLEMLRFIIKASSDEKSVVMDCFCGSGSTLKAASICGRRWIGVDKSDTAIEITKRRFSNGDSIFDNDYDFLEFDSKTL